MAMKMPLEYAVRDHGPTVLRVCRAALGPGPDADDAWVDTFLAATRAWDELADDTNVEAWLVRVAQRKIVDVVRARGRASPAEVPERAANDAAVEPVWDAVARLPERQRLAIAYHYFGGLAHSETAELIGGSTDAVRRAAADGLKTLRKTYLDKEGNR